MQVVITSKQNIDIPQELQEAKKKELSTKILWEFDDVVDAQHAAVACVSAGFEFVQFTPTY